MTENEKDGIMWGLLANFELPLDHSTRCQVANAYKNLIEQHEAFRQEVSDAVSMCRTSIGLNTELDRFIIAKPDPLVEVIAELGMFPAGKDNADQLRAALAKRGGRIVFDD